MRCTWRKLGCLGSRATRERCLTVEPRCASPSTPRPAMSRMLLSAGFEKPCVALRLTAATTAPIAWRPLILSAKDKGRCRHRPPSVDPRPVLVLAHDRLGRDRDLRVVPAILQPDREDVDL